MAVVFSIFCVPETNNVELEDMDEKFGGGVFARDKTVEESANEVNTTPEQSSPVNKDRADSKREEYLTAA